MRKALMWTAGIFVVLVALGLLTDRGRDFDPGAAESPTVATEAPAPTATAPDSAALAEAQAEREEEVVRAWVAGWADRHLEPFGRIISDVGRIEDWARGPRYQFRSSGTLGTVYLEDGKVVGVRASVDGSMVQVCQGAEDCAR